MEAVGRLAGGVAHDFNNLLTVISGYTEVLLKDLDPQNPLRTSAEAIRAATQRAASLTRQLLAFGRKQVLELKTINLNGVLEDVSRLLGPLLGENVHLVTHPEPNLGLSKADAGQIAQVIMNLAVNARDAMSSGGTLLIETANVELDDAYRRGHFTLTPGPYVMLAISDTGCGMDAETQSRIFEPFFTTKEKGKGTGLGLSTVYGIVKQSGGHIFVYSEVGRGTTFKIYFPRTGDGVALGSQSSCTSTTWSGSENVLVVEDEDSVRELVLTTLKRHGYSVLEASNGEEALAMVEQRSEPIHLLISDVVMPGLGGRELARKLGALHPEMKMVFVSGKSLLRWTHSRAKCGMS
jgi:two-component sensor histidine kinase